jgi:Spy/CpxP family protein refolding chaperone
MTGKTGRKVVGYAFALFAAGAVCGAVFMPKPAEKQPTTLKLGRQQEIAAKMRDKLRCSLDLTPEQLKRIDPLILKASEEVEMSHQICLIKIISSLECLDSQIREELSPEQKQKLSALEAERCKSIKEKYNFPPDSVTSKPTH